MLGHEHQGNLDVGYVEHPAMPAGAFGFAFVVVGTIEECDGQCDACPEFIEHRGGIDASGENQQGVRAGMHCKLVRGEYLFLILGREENVGEVMLVYYLHTNN